MDTLLFCREYFEETYAQLAAGLFSEHADAFPSDVFTAAAFTWAAVAVRSRSRPPLVGDDFALVPIADLVRQACTAFSCIMQQNLCSRRLGATCLVGLGISLCSTKSSQEASAVMQLQHSRSGAITSKLEVARFGGARSLKLSCNRQLAAGSVASADLEPERLDNQMLLDYGVLDEDSPQVRQPWHYTPGGGSKRPAQDAGRTNSCGHA